MKFEMTVAEAKECVINHAKKTADIGVSALTGSSEDTTKHLIQLGWELNELWEAVLRLQRLESAARVRSEECEDDELKPAKRKSKK